MPQVFIYLDSNAVILLKFWRTQPTLPCFGLQYSISKKTRTTVSLSSMQGSLPSLRFVNRHGGTLRRAGWVAFTKTYSRGMCERRFYARSHGKITRQWKSTLTLITIVSALTLSIKKYFV